MDISKMVSIIPDLVNEKKHDEAQNILTDVRNKVNGFITKLRNTDADLCKELTLLYENLSYVDDYINNSRKDSTESRHSELCKTQVEVINNLMPKLAQLGLS